MRRVDIRPPGPRAFSTRVTGKPAWAMRREQVSPDMPAPTTATCGVTAEVRLDVRGRWLSDDTWT